MMDGLNAQISSSQFPESPEPAGTRVLRIVGILGTPSEIELARRRNAS